VDAVLAGAKTATAGLAEEDPPPPAGARYVVEDAAGTARAIVEVTEARVVPAGQIDLRFAQDEGEGFESVEEWREAHERFFGRPIDDETSITAIRFRIVERL
jgi:uncharacterized protein YhfF